MTIIYLAIALAVTAGIAWVYFFYYKDNQAEFDYRRKKPLNEIEEELYWKLLQTLPQHIVLAQVALTKLVSSSSAGARECIAHKYVNFVICNRDLSIVAAVELDDRLRNKGLNSKKSSAIKKQALDKAGIKLINWKALSLPDESEIRHKVLGLPPKPIKLADVQNHVFDTGIGSTIM